MATKLLGKYQLNGRIVCVTGLHIGGSAAGLEIGGIDNPVIKDPLTDEPVIPGSSLKGKLRSLAEWYLGLIEKHPKHNGYQAYACEDLKNSSGDQQKRERVLQLARLFGPATDDSKVRETAGPTRLTVRDAYLTPSAKQSLEDNLGKGSFTEVKTENAIDRVTSEANPRPIERVPAGADFNISLIVDCYEQDDHKLFRLLFTSMSLLEHSSLGGGGSRGSGQIAFKDLELTWRSAEDYAKGQAGSKVTLPGSKVQEILGQFDKISWPQT
ncbi:MAG: type III-A CRISPR-associated RAMP protein Csm3 [Anaerolineales bacterium]